MITIITIYGASDNLVEVAGCEGAGEFNSDHWSADLIAPDGAQMAVWCWYTRRGCWAVGVAQTDEDFQLPAWPISITQAQAMNPDNNGYSVLLSIGAPEGTRLVHIKGSAS